MFTREYTKAEDVDLSKGPIVQSLTIQIIEEKPKETPVQNSLDMFTAFREASPRRRSRSRSRSRGEDEYSYGVNERHRDNCVLKVLIVKVMNETVGNGM